MVVVVLEQVRLKPGSKKQTDFIYIQLSWTVGLYYKDMVSWSVVQSCDCFSNIASFSLRQHRRFL
jgi:hypothetical protein